MKTKAFLVSSVFCLFLTGCAGGNNTSRQTTTLPWINVDQSPTDFIYGIVTRTDLTGIEKRVTLEHTGTSRQELKDVLISKGKTPDEMKAIFNDLGMIYPNGN